MRRIRSFVVRAGHLGPPVVLHDQVEDRQAPATAQEHEGE
jgi:hypothetical protein